jgi:hypothetical protein
LVHVSSKKAIAAELKKLEIEMKRVQITLGRNVLEVAFKSRIEDREPKIVRIVFNSFEVRSKREVKRFLVLGYFSYYLAQPKTFRKRMREYNEETACAKCGGAHDSNACPT